MFSYLHLSLVFLRMFGDIGQGSWRQKETVVVECSAQHRAQPQWGMSEVDTLCIPGVLRTLTRTLFSVPYVHFSRGKEENFLSWSRSLWLSTDVIEWDRVRSIVNVAHIWWNLLHNCTASHPHCFHWHLYSGPAIAAQSVYTKTAVNNIFWHAQEDLLFCAVWLEGYERIWDGSVNPEGMPSAQWNIRCSQYF